MTTTTPSQTTKGESLLVQVASYNTNLQGNAGLPQDLVDWLAPTLIVSRFLSVAPQISPRTRTAASDTSAQRAPDIVAVGFQELLPLHLGFAGLSNGILASRDALLRAQIEAHAPDRARYSLVARVVNVGIALLVYARDDDAGRCETERITDNDDETEGQTGIDMGEKRLRERFYHKHGAISRRVCNVQTQYTGCGPAWLGNKGAVGVRFRLLDVDAEDDDGGGEIFTFVNTHLTASEGKMESRIADFHHAVGTLVFPPIPRKPARSSSPSLTTFCRLLPNWEGYSTIYDTSHLFFLGDLNSRLDLPPSLADPNSRPLLLDQLKSTSGCEALAVYDELTRVRRAGRAFLGLHEGPFWRFKCTYKYKINEVDTYSNLRLPAWTDRILFASYFDEPDAGLDESAIEPILYTSIPSYTTSDHKPIVALFRVPTSFGLDTQAVGTSEHPYAYAPSLQQSTSEATYVSHTSSTLVSASATEPLLPHRAVPFLRLPSTYTPRVDPFWVIKRFIGTLLTRIIGFFWMLLIFAGLSTQGARRVKMVIALLTANARYGWGLIA